MRSRSIELSYLQDMDKTLFEIREVGPCLDKYGMGRNSKNRSTKYLHMYPVVILLTLFHRGRCNNRKTQRGGKARIPIEQINGRMKKSSSFYGKRICLDQIWIAVQI